MTAGWIQTVAPTVEPVTLAEAKAHARVYTDADDTELEAFIAASRDLAEKATRRQLITATWELAADSFPAVGYIELPRPPLQTVTHVKYLDTAGVLQTLDSALYVVDVRGLVGRVQLKSNQVWPATLEQSGAVVVTYVAGYGATGAAVPALLRQGILMRVAHWYANKESTISGTIIASVPDGPARIDAIYRVPGEINRHASW